MKLAHPNPGPESEPFKPEKETHPSPVMPTIPKLSTSGNDLTPIDPTAVLIKVLGLIDQTPTEYADDVPSHVCELEPESKLGDPVDQNVTMVFYQEAIT